MQNGKIVSPATSMIPSTPPPSTLPNLVNPPSGHSTPHPRACLPLPSPPNVNLPKLRSSHQAAKGQKLNPQHAQPPPPPQRSGNPPKPRLRAARDPRRRSSGSRRIIRTMSSCMVISWLSLASQRRAVCHARRPYPSFLRGRGRAARGRRGKLPALSRAEGAAGSPA